MHVHVLSVFETVLFFEITNDCPRIRTRYVCICDICLASGLLSDGINKPKFEVASEG